MDRVTTFEAMGIVSILQSVKRETKQITNAPTRERVAAAEERNVISLNVLERKPVYKVDEMLKLLHESSMGLKTTGDTLFVHTSFSVQNK